MVFFSPKPFPHHFGPWWLWQPCRWQEPLSCQKLCPKPLSCPKQATTTSTTPLARTQPLKEVEFSLCPHSFDCPRFQTLLKAKEGATVFAGGPPSVNWRHHVPESYSRANEAPALGAAFPPPIIHRTHNNLPIIHRTAPRALTTPSCSFVQQTQFNRKSTDTKLEQSKSQPSNAFPPLRKNTNKSEQFQQQQVLSRTCTIFDWCHARCGGYCAECHTKHVVKNFISHIFKFYSKMAKKNVERALHPIYCKYP